MKEKKSNRYYHKFSYRIQKKLTVEDHRKIKDYSKLGLYMYIIHETFDNNRFLYISSKHYEENTRLEKRSFKLQKYSGANETAHFKKRVSKFGVLYFRLMKEKADISIMFQDVVSQKGKSGFFFNKYKIHSKKIALEHPDYFIEIIKKLNIKSHKKRILRELLYNNKYNEEIINHTISTMFQLQRSELQKFNDHSVVLDEGKTGKSSLIGYMGEKLDNLSIAGLYGSSDSKHGKFKGGIVTTSDKTILIDEINELAEDKKGEKILSVLNSLLENGVYNYQKQFGQKIRAGNQFVFMANVGDKFNLAVFLLGTFGNVMTIGRRIGMITYNLNLKGFKKGNIRPETPSIYLNSISMFMSELLNSFFNNSKNITKLYKHSQYRKLERNYNKQLTSINKDIHDLTVKQFIKSHKNSIDRIFMRGLKMYIFNNINKFITGELEINNHTIYEALEETEKHINMNIDNFENIKNHLENLEPDETISNFNIGELKKLKKNELLMLKLIHENIDKVNNKGLSLNDLNNIGNLKFLKQDIKRYGLKRSFVATMYNYGVSVRIESNELMIRFINKLGFIDKMKGFKLEKK